MGHHADPVRQRVTNEWDARGAITHGHVGGIKDRILLKRFFGRYARTTRPPERDRGSGELSEFTSSPSLSRF